VSLWLLAGVHVCCTYLGTYLGLTMAHRRRDAIARQLAELQAEEMRRAFERIAARRADAEGPN
jgi:hypothetical protein